jgi:hypothetical protein
MVATPEVIMSTTAVEQRWALLEGIDLLPVQRFDRETISSLPDPAQRLLAAAIRDGAPLLSTVELSMRGQIKLGKWLPFTARQIVRAGVGFVWEPVVGGRVLRFVGADSLGPEGARMEFRFHGRIPVVRGSGADVERSAAGRLAAETVAWLPQALTPQAGAVWRPVDDERATVVLPGPMGPVPVDVAVDERGALVGIQLQRWKDSAKPPADASFGGPVTSIFDTDGIRVAGEGSVGWDRGTPKEAEGVFFRYTITSVHFLPTVASHP